jgi:hypothetical protein
MAFTTTEKVDVLNIGLMLLSACIAMVIPFETFLFVYAVLGPLHYLTEISWLHDKQYFTKGKYDAVVLLLCAGVLAIFETREKLGIEFPDGFNANIVFVALLSSVVFFFVKNNFYKWAGIILLVIMSKLANNFTMFLTLFIPTLVHVYVFTLLFMLYGALKSKSRFGLLSVFILILCPILLFTIFPDRAFYVISEPAKSSYLNFKYLNILTLKDFFHQPLPDNMQGWNDIIFHSKTGILIMRVIAFAYTYHYINWFSKTNVIQWHKVPKWRFVVVILVWIAGAILYLIDYTAGFQWLYFLAFLHVILEFPLNIMSISGILGHLKGKVLKPATVKTNNK